MIKIETIDYQQKIYDTRFVYNCMSGRVAEVTHHLSKEAGVLFSVKTTKSHQDDYISITIRTQQSFLALSKHIEQLYGGYIIPLMKKANVKKNPELACEQYQIYLNVLINHRVIRSDPVLFAFCFVQEKQGSAHQSKYQRFLTNAIELSRKHLNKLLTRQDKEEHTQIDQQLERYRLSALEKKQRFEKIKLSVQSNLSEQHALYQIWKIIGGPQSSYYYAISAELGSKCERVSTMFQEIEGAYSRRLILLQHIKELKANNIRHKYNSKLQSTQKILEVERNKNASWTEVLLQQMECTLVILDSLIKEIVSKYLIIQRMAYEDQENQSAL